MTYLFKVDVLPRPGTPGGACLPVSEGEDCRDESCAELRATAADVCRYCGEAIGYARGFVMAEVANDPGVWERAHASCVLHAAEQSV